MSIISKNLSEYRRYMDELYKSYNESDEDIKVEESYYIKEGKQVGNLYHVCTLDALVNYIIPENKLEASGKYWNGLLKTDKAISFTRDSTFVVPTNTVFEAPLLFRFTIDGDKLSEHYKITPFNGNGVNPKIREKEEVVIGPITNFKSYIKEAIFDIKDLGKLKEQTKYISDIKKVIQYLGNIKCKRYTLPILNLDDFSINHKKSKDWVYNINSLEELIDYINDESEVSIDDIDTSDLLRKFITSGTFSKDDLEYIYNKNPKLFTTNIFDRIVRRNIVNIPLDILKFCISKDKDINLNMEDSNGITLFQYAFINNNVDLMGFLLKNNVDTSDFLKPFKRPCKIEILPKTIKVLADNNIKLEYAPVINNTLAKAIFSNNQECVSNIIRLGYKDYINDTLEIRYGESFIPICYACFLGKIDIIKSLLKFGANPNITDTQKSTPLIITTTHSFIKGAEIGDIFKICKLLLDNGASKTINSRNLNKSTAMVSICRLNSKYVFNIVKLFLENGASKSVNMKDNNNDTPLSLACKFDNIRLVKLLLDNGADTSINVTNKDGDTPILIASKKGYKTILKLLITYEPDLHVTNKSGENLLLNLCKTNNSELAKIVINNGADVNVKSESGFTPLQYACDNNNLTLVRLLIQKGANVNDVRLSRIQNVTILKLLFKNGYNADSENAKIALRSAVEGKVVPIIKVLLENKVNPNIKNYLGTLLANVCGHAPDIEIAKLLIEHGADVNSKDKNGYTPLHLACANNNVEIVKLLLDNGAIKSLPTNKNKLPDYITRNEEIKNLILSYYN